MSRYTITEGSFTGFSPCYETRLRANNVRIDCPIKYVFAVYCFLAFVNFGLHQSIINTFYHLQSPITVSIMFVMFLFQTHPSFFCAFTAIRPRYFSILCGNNSQRLTKAKIKLIKKSSFRRYCRRLLQSKMGQQRSQGVMKSIPKYV